MVPATIYIPASDPAEVTVATLTHAMETGRDHALSGWPCDPHAVPGIRLSASQREAYQRGYARGLEQEAEREQERFRQLELDLETAEGWEAMTNA